MANRITIRHGNTAPDTDDLLPYELGWDGTNLVLYINNNGIIKSIGGSGSFLPLTGGNMTGGISITHSTSSDIGYLIKNNNSSHQAGLIIGGSSGNGGLYDFTASKWVVYCDTSGNVTLNGKSNSTGAIVTSGSVATRKVWVTTSASVPSGAENGDIVLVKV